MLREALEWLTTRTVPGTRWSGHLVEFVAIAARRRRHQSAWLDHEGRSRAAILRAVTSVSGDGSALILGAGHANDIPLEDLADRFERVTLVDLAFARNTMIRADRLGRVDCVRHDVTEALGHPERADVPTRWIDDPDIRFVASVNLLSQLPTVATRDLPEADADRIGKNLIQAHLDWLKRFDCPVCLIADTEIEILGTQDEVIATIDPNRGVRLPEATETWLWDIAPKGEIDRHHAVRHRVAVIDRL